MTRKEGPARRTTPTTQVPQPPLRTNVSNSSPSLGFKPSVDTPPAASATATAQDIRSWERVSAKLKARLGTDVYQSWFGRARIEDVNGPLVTLSVPTNFLRSWIRTHYAAPLLQFWQEEDEKIARIDLVVRSAARNTASPEAPASQDHLTAPALPDRATAPSIAGPQTTPRRAVEAPPLDRTQAPAAPNANVPAVGFDGSPLDPRYTFANLVEGKTNEMALAAARSVAQAIVQPGSPGPRFNPLFLHAGVGLGKTHLLQSIAWAVKSSASPQAQQGAKEPKILYLTAEYFMWRFASAIRDGGALSFKESLRDIDLLLIDDMQFLQGKSIQQEFCHLLNALIDSAKQVVVAADRPPAELESLDARVRSRLQGGVAIAIGAPEFALRRAMLVARIEAAQATDPGFAVDGAIIDHVARQVTGSGRDIEGALNQILMHHRFGQGELTLDKVDQMLGHLVQAAEPKRVRIEDIQKIVSRHFNVERNDLLSSRRTQVVVRPRQIAMYLSKKLTPRSLPEIGRRFGGRDHTTVLHAVRKIDKLADEDKTLAQEIELLKRLIMEG